MLQWQSYSISLLRLYWVALRQTCIFHFAGSGDPEDYMKHFLQTLVIAEIAEVYLRTTFPTSCRGHLVLCNREDHQISQTNRAATLMLLGAFCSLLDLLKKQHEKQQNLYITGSFPVIKQKEQHQFLFLRFTRLWGISHLKVNANF